MSNLGTARHTQALRDFAARMRQSHMADPTRVKKYNEDQQAKARREALAIATARKESLNPTESAREVQAAEQDLKDRIRAGHTPDEIRLAWDALQPLLGAGLSYFDLIDQANTLTEVAAVQTFAPPLLRADAIRRKGGDRLATADNDLEDLDRRAARTAERLGLDTGDRDLARRVDDETNAWKVVWASLANMEQPGIATLTALKQVDTAAYEALLDASSAMRGGPAA
ncbi:hypothetical protein [Actinomyces provencensis]|uniref:hypothetical protein n=1 Tax=Actinomyces provencensis TaxID=1720198 RepID=UPI00096AB82B|nr:hypothetical protein [Actinomyces provencensis]